MGELTEDERLELATASALRGAPDVRKRLLLEMSAGTPSITDLAYAVKVRIKDDFRIAEKVVRKREAKAPDYDVRRLRDIVGLRIVTLYRLDAITILPILLDRIFDSSGNDDSNLFLKNPIEEVKIYSLNPIGDAQNLVGRLRPLFDARGLLEKLEVENKPSNYTSIHIVAWARGKYSSKYRTVPVEIQIRTAFEDVWGEIEHGLKYKPKGPAVDEDEEELQRSTITPHLNVLATLIDGMAQYSDQIKIQIDSPKERRVRSIRSRLAEKPLERLIGTDGIPVELMELVRDAVGHSRMCFDEAAQTDYPMARHVAAKRRASDDLATVASRVRQSTDVEEDKKREVLYVLDMERALLLFEYGNGLAGRSGNGALVEASRIYSRVESEFPNRGAVQYRLAKVLDALGDSKAAQYKLEQLVANMDKTDLHSSHWVRAAARRYLGVLYWEEGRQGGVANDGPEETGWPAESRELFGKAYAITKPILKMSVEGAADPNETQGISESEKAVNNLLYYAVELLMGEAEEHDIAEYHYVKGDLRVYLTSMEASTSPAAEDFRHLDTLRRAYKLLRDRQKARSVTEALIEALKQKGILDRPGGGREEEILHAALATIAWCEEED